MRVLHCCLAAFYIDNYGYQENVFPKMHKMQGHEVEILASTETYLENKSLGYVKPSSYLNEHDILVNRIPYAKFIPKILSKKLRIYKGIYESISRFKPDVLFIHDCQFIGIKEIARYVQNNPGVTVYVDSHTDMINSAKNWVSKNILHKIIYRWCAKKIEPFTKKFYGTLPLRMDFYEKIYQIDKEKLELLVIGSDHSEVDFSKKAEIRARIRKKLMISDSSFVLITGGKIDERKQIHLLMKSMKTLCNNDIHLIIFGVPTTDMKEKVDKLSKGKNIHNVGWLSTNEMNDYILSADLGVFPGTHSTIWEQSVGLGLPSIFKKWKGIQHVDLGGNCMFIEDVSPSNLATLIMQIKKDEKRYQEMHDVSVEKGINNFSYYEIAKRAIEI